MRSDGISCRVIAEHIGKKIHAVQQFVYRAGLSHKINSKASAGKRYDWRAVQDFYDAGHSRKECLVKFAMSPNAWDIAGKRGRLRLRPLIPRLDFFAIHKIRSASSLRYHLSKLGKLTGRCAVCGITDWLGKPLVIQFDHRNGDHADNRLENVREICPNCHSQTPTYGNKRRAKIKGTPTEALIKKRSAAGASDLTVACELQCSPATVAAVVKGWKRRYS